MLFALIKQKRMKRYNWFFVILLSYNKHQGVFLTTFLSIFVEAKIVQQYFSKIVTQ